MLQLQVPTLLASMLKAELGWPANLLSGVDDKTFASVGWLWKLEAGLQLT